jgi:hypothetical protein
MYLWDAGVSATAYVLGYSGVFCVQLCDAEFDLPSVSVEWGQRLVPSLRDCTAELHATILHIRSIRGCGV